MYLQEHTMDYGSIYVSWILGMNTFFGMLMLLTNNSILWVPSDLTWNGL